MVVSLMSATVLLPCHPLGLLVTSQGDLWRSNPLRRLVASCPVGTSILRNLFSNITSMTISVITYIVKCLLQMPVQNKTLVLLSGTAHGDLAPSSDSSPTSLLTHFR